MPVGISPFLGLIHSFTFKVKLVFFTLMDITVYLPQSRLLPPSLLSLILSLLSTGLYTWSIFTLVIHLFPHLRYPFLLNFVFCSSNISCSLPLAHFLSFWKTICICSPALFQSFTLFLTASTHHLLKLKTRLKVASHPMQKFNCYFSSSWKITFVF